MKEWAKLDSGQSPRVVVLGIARTPEMLDLGVLRHFSLQLEVPTDVPPCSHYCLCCSHPPRICNTVVLVSEQHFISILVVSMFR